MYEGHCDRPLTHCGGHPFDIAGPDVPDGEHARQRRLEKMRVPRERPMRGGQIVVRQIGPCLDEPFSIERDASMKPLGAGNGTGHKKDVPYVVGLDASRLRVAPAYAFEMMSPF